MSEKIYGQLDVETVEKLASLVKEKELEEITIECGECKISVKGKKCPPPRPEMPPMMPPMMAPMMPQGAAAPVAPAQAEQAPAAPAVEGKTVKAPIVGTYYASPAPDKAPFVQVGDTVKKGDVIMIIESMKLMNEVQSDVEGVVKEILVKNGDAVEYDQPLMIIG